MADIEKLIDSVCHTAAEIQRGVSDDKTQGIINLIREKLETALLTSPQPVGEIIAWAGTDREKGITREVDFRFLRFDVLPGTKLYAIEPAPAAKSDLLTRAEALAVETRALASRIKAAE